MENKINIAELLKDCSSGMELDCTMYEDVYFDYVDELNIIHCYILYETHRTSITFNQYGTPNSNIKSKCVIFPKGKTTWEGFQSPFKDGDVVISYLGNIHILKNRTTSYCCCDGMGVLNKNWTTNIVVVRLATETEKQKLFQAIKDNGYKWNSETKTLEELIQPKFKVGDVVKSKNCPEAGSFVIVSVGEDTYLINLKKYCIKFKDQDNYELINAPKFKVGDRVKHISDYTSGIVTKVSNKGYYIDYPKGKGVCYISFTSEKDYKLVPNKFDITTLKPFESRVLVRDNDFDTWKPSFWGYLRRGEFMYDTVRGVFRQCIPYEGNKHLMNTADDCDKFFKTWEK